MPFHVAWITVYIFSTLLVGGGSRLGNQSSGVNSSVDSPPTDHVRSYPWHTNIIATTFWVGEVFLPGAPDGSQVFSTYDPFWEQHYGGCDGKVVSGHCDTEKRRPENGYFPTSMQPKENPFYLDLPYDDVDDPKGFALRGILIPWSHDFPYVFHVRDHNYSLMKNRWVEIVGPNTHTCYGQIEDAGPGVYDDWTYVFGTKDQRPSNMRYNGAGMDVSPALNCCLGFKDLNGDTDRVHYNF